MNGDGQARDIAGSGAEDRRCDGSGPGRGRRGRAPGAAQSSLGGRTATRALIAVGTYVAQDLRDAEGLTRPMLRRAALRLALSRRRAGTPAGQRVPAAGSAGAGRARAAGATRSKRAEPRLRPGDRLRRRT